MTLRPMFEGTPSLRLSPAQEAQFDALCAGLRRELGGVADITPQPERTGAQSALTLRLTGRSGRARTLRLCVSGFVRWPEAGFTSPGPLVIHAVDAADVMALAAGLHRRLLHNTH
ncbi:TPA: hypothetical protein OME38_004595 [Klebsiella oxytoca]|nr:hypothetical protein [Klebsiella oxytoca]